MNARVNNLPGTTPLVAMALIDMAVSKVCVEGKGTDFNGQKLPILQCYPNPNHSWIRPFVQIHT